MSQRNVDPDVFLKELKNCTKAKPPDIESCTECFLTSSSKFEFQSFLQNSQMMLDTR